MLALMFLARSNGADHVAEEDSEEDSVELKDETEVKASTYSKLRMTDCEKLRLFFRIKMKYCWKLCNKKED